LFDEHTNFGMWQVHMMVVVNTTKLESNTFSKREEVFHRNTIWMEWKW